MALSKDEVKARVQEAVQTGNFFFPEDVVRGIAEHFDINVEGTPLGQVAPANSPTRGDVHPDPEEVREYIRKRELKQERREQFPTAEADLEDKVEAGPIYPDGPEKDAAEEQAKQATEARKAQAKESKSKGSK